MKEADYLAHSARTPMTALRRDFNRGVSLYHTPPESLSAAEAAEDADYARYVLENAYSGYSYYDAELFRRGFAAIRETIAVARTVTPRALIGLFGAQLDFLSDGHLAFALEDDGAGFYRKQQTYVTDLRLARAGDGYADAASGAPVRFDAPLRALPALPQGGEARFLLGVRSKEPVTEVTVWRDADPVTLPVHRIASRETAETLREERYVGDTAVIASAGFVGDDAADLARFEAAGRRCRGYRRVVWDLSGNLGGNSEFPKRFLTGLTGGFADPVRTLALESTLVHAKETGEVRDVPYRLTEVRGEPAENADLFAGELHVILNDRVASSAELAVAWAASLPRVTFYGCNSLGIGRFGDLCVYELPHSKILLWCPQKVFLQGIPETFGFEPDFWIDSPDPVSAVLDCLRTAAAT